MMIISKHEMVIKVSLSERTRGESKPVLSYIKKKVIYRIGRRIRRTFFWSVLVVVLLGATGETNEEKI